jgi:hypothetical protein
MNLTLSEVQALYNELSRNWVENPEVKMLLLRMRNLLDHLINPPSDTLHEIE